MNISIFVSETHRKVTLQPLENSRITTIDAVQRKEGGKWQPAQVNWPAIGEVSPTEALKFSQAIAVAAVVANEVLVADEIPTKEHVQEIIDDMTGE